MEGIELIKYIKDNYKIKEEYSLNLFIGEVSRNYVCFVYKKVGIISKKYGKKDYAETFIGNISTKDRKELKEFMEPYIIKIDEKSENTDIQNNIRQSGVQERSSTNNTVESISFDNFRA